MYSYSPLLQAVFDACARHPEKIAIIAGKEEVSYSQLCQNIKKAAALIQSKGYKAGDTIMLSAVKEPYFIYMDLGAQLLGVIDEMIDPELGIETFVYDPAEIDGMTPYEGLPEGLKETDVIEILHTTGTTSKPKSVCLSHYNIFWAAKNTSDFVQNDEQDVEVVVMPICHAFGLRRVHLTLMNGATVVLLPNFANVQLLFKTMEKYHVTTFGMAPAAWAYVKKISGTRISRFANQLRHIEFGTAAMPMAGKKEVVDLLPNTRICHNYGLTESNRSAMIEYHDTEHLDSVGKPIADNMKIKIIDGEICVHGNQTMVGYLDPEDNREAFVEGFFRTGDCGYVSDEGYIYLTGRAKEMISVGGKKVSPVEVEETICDFGVGDCICVSHPDEMLGETVKAYVLKGSTELTLEEIDEKMKATMPVYKCPTQYEWIDEIPVNSLGKKQRRVLMGK
jgi:long-chain acyl-CoA synthetase